MRHVEVPNLPAGEVKAVIIDGRAPEEIKNSLLKRGVSVIPTLAHPGVYAAVSFHPDIMLLHIRGNIMVYAPGTPRQLLDSLSCLGFEMIRGYTLPGNKYPFTIPYNVAMVGNFAFHNTKYTDPVVKELLLENGYELIHTNQGYAKCLTCVVNENSLITSDRDIHKRALRADIDSLLIEPDTSIKLEPFDMGFIGGATGLLSKNRLGVTGDLRFHKNSSEILSFLSLKGVDVVMLYGEKLIDLGTIIPILED